jgi:serine/threonine-protein kinase HipA
MVVAKIKIWGILVGAVLWDDAINCARFEYDSNFLKKGLDIAPIVMPVAIASNELPVYAFPSLSRETYKGLPGLLADSLPDRFGNKLIDAWLAQQGRDPNSVNSVEKLCYIGKRGMGAISFEPSADAIQMALNSVQIDSLVKLAQDLLNEKTSLHTNLNKDEKQSLLQIIKVGTSAGGARAKAIIAYKEKTGDVKSRQLESDLGYSYWIIKFDGVTNSELGDPARFGKIEYAYHKMAVDCGIIMSECRVLTENGRTHFMTKRFDRPFQNEKLHLQTLCAIAHFDYNEAGAYSYEQAFQVMRQLRLPYTDAEQLYTRMAFNVIARNQDDHTKNISFLMNKEGIWKLSPAYDVTYAYDPTNKWMSSHQMTINGKRDNITRTDLLKIAKEMNIKKPNNIIDTVLRSINKWSTFATDAGIPKSQINAIGAAHILDI